VVKLKDGYQLFLQRFKIQKEDLIRFGIEETISIEEEVARIEWSRIKDILNGKEKAPIYIRRAGRNSSSTNLYLDLYEHLFPGVEILVDRTNNDQPRKTLAKCTNFKPAKADTKKHKALLNYQVSHIFGRTKNPYTFTAPWNIVYLPKIMDPFTGHESKGEVTMLFTEAFQMSFYDKYNELIYEYNQIMMELQLEIEFYTNTLKAVDSGINSANSIDVFKRNVLKEFEVIKL
jgi:hypothetical protein